MSVVDNRIVRMIFDNASFKKAAAETKGALDSVNQAVNNAGKNSGLLDLSKGMDAVAVKAGKMQVAVLTAVGTLANKATNAALGALNSLTLGPMKQGFQEYGELLTKQNVIMNATGKSAKTVKKILAELNTYSDKTIYSFGDMTSALTRFVNAGVPLNQATKAIKGVANAAAFAGASATESQSAFHGFSDAMGVGYIGLQDWMQIRTAHMDTIQFKQGLIDAAVAVGTLTKQGDHYLTSNKKLVTATTGFNDNLKQHWATTAVMTKALSVYSDMTTKVGRKATLAATQVRTFGAFMDTTKEAIGSGWANVFTALFGGLNEATAMWTGLSSAVGGVIGAFFKFWTITLQTWRDMGGFTKAVQGFKNVLSPIAALFKAIGDAWKAAFPNSGKGAGATLYGLSYAFELLTRPLTWLAKLIGLLVHPLTLFFAIIKLGIAIIKSAGTYVGDFFKKMFGLVTFKPPSAGGLWQWIKDLVVAIKDAVTHVTELLDKGKSIKDAFKDFHISMPKLPNFKMPKLPNFGDVGLVKGIGALFGFGKKSEASDSITNVRELESRVGSLGSTIKSSVFNLSDYKRGFTGVKSSVVDNIANIKFLEGGVGDLSNKVNDGITNIRELETGFGSLGSVVGDGVDNIKELEGGMGSLDDTMTAAKDKGSSFLDVVKGIGTWIKDLFSNITGKDITTSLNFAVLATMGTMFAKVLFSIHKLLTNFSKIGEGAGDALSGLGEGLKSFQTAAKAKLILNIAFALAILAASLWVLSTIPEAKLKTAFKGLAGVIVAFSVILFMFSKTLKSMGPGAVMQMYALGFAIAAIGLGLLLLAGAMLIMKKVGTKDLLKGLSTLVVVFVGLNVLGKLASTSAKNMFAAGAAMVLIGGALIILAGALLLFKLVDWKSMSKAGLVLLALTASLFILDHIPAANLLAIGAAMLAIAGAMTILAVALIIFAIVKWESIIKAGTVLLFLTLALIGLTAFGATGAPVIIAVAGAVLILAVAMLALNKVDWTSIWKAAVILVILIAALALLFVVLAIAAPVVPLLTTLAIGLGAMAFGIALLVTALALALPIFAAGVGAFAAFAAAAAVSIAVFLQTLAEEAPLMKEAAIKILQVFVDGVVESIPIILDGIKRVLKAIWDFFAGPTTTDTGAKGGDSILRSFQKKLQEWTPKILDAVEAIMRAFLKKLHDNEDNIAAAAVDLIVALIRGIGSKIDDVVREIGKLLVALLGAIGAQVQPITDAGADLIISFINGVASTIKTKGPELGAAMGNLGVAMVEGMVKGIASMAWAPVKAIGDLAGSAISKAGHVLGIHSPSKVFMEIGGFMVDGLTLGIQNHAVAAITALSAVLTGQIALATSYISGYVQKLDQQSMAARAKAEGMAKSAELASAAADRASTAAGKTKSKKDDAAAEKQKTAAEKLKETADKQSAAADALQAKADKAREVADRKAEYDKASLIDKAKMRSEDAQRQIDDAKAAEQVAANDLAQAKAIEAAAKSKTLSKTEAAAMKKEAAALRADAKTQANLANSSIAAAKQSAADALALQKQAGAEAAAEFQKRFDAEAKADADQAAYEAMTDEQKAATRRQQAAALTAKSNADLAAAKALAYTDLEAANDLASQAIDEANTARDYVNEAVDLEKSVADAKKAAEDQAAEDAKYVRPVNIPIEGTTSVDVTASDAAAIAFQNYTDLYSSSSAAASAGQTVQFNQYNTSPEALSPTEVYRQTNNLLTHASDKLGKVA